MMVAATWSFQSCEYFKKGGGGSDSTAAVVDTLQFTTVSYSDTVVVLDATITQVMKVAYPVAEAKGALADSLRAFLVEEVVANSVPYYDQEKVPQAVSEYQPGQEQAFLSAQAGEGMTRMVGEVRSMAEEGFAAGYENEYTIRMSVQTPDYLTLEIGHYTYMGGAHGGFGSEGVTFRKSDGRKMGWNLFDLSKKQQIIALIREQLKTYFAFDENKKPISDEELQEQLQVWDDPDTPENELEYGLPLPTTAPYVTRDGIAFVYQQYEIAAYACGLPSGILSFESVRDVLSDEGKNLLGLE